MLGALQGSRDCGWRRAVEARTPYVFPSRSRLRAWMALREQVAAGLDVPPTSDSDVEVAPQRLPRVEIRMVGYSWGGWTVLQLASRLARDPWRLHPSIDPTRLALRVGVLDPVRTLRARLRFPRGLNATVVNVYQRNGCWKRCAGNSMWYAGSPVPGAHNINVTTDGRHRPERDGVPASRAPDHMQLGYFSWRGFDDEVASVLDGLHPRIELDAP